MTLLRQLAAGLLGATVQFAPAQPARADEAIPLALIEGLSGSFANAGEAVYRNLLMAVERVNRRGGVRLPGGPRRLELQRYDSKGGAEEAQAMLRAALDRQVAFVLQGNSSAVAAALIDALNKHNQREPQRRAIFLNYSAVDPVLTNQKCSFWHFRFDAHADMRLAALVDVLAEDAAVRKLYLIGQDYSFGQHVVKAARSRVAARRPDIEIVGEELHPVGRVKDFLPYALKIKASGAQAVLTGNWGNDLTLLVKAAREAGVEARFYTFYGNALGAPAAIGEAGVGKVLAVAEWHPNVGTDASERFYTAFRERFPRPEDDYVHARMQVLVEMLVAAIERAGSTDAQAVGRALEGMEFDGQALGGLHQGTMRAADHQFIQPLVVSVMDKAGTPGVRHDNEGSGYGFRTVRRLDAAQTEQPHQCTMERP
ncbi:MAG: branched-chain amino acid ABC transporter substrate-binding protein [Piscinibacter sp.]|nr:branched-chain amino acid ABC transporter substrate-binding protein [Piscinibacter sp.]